MQEAIIKFFSYAMGSEAVTTWLPRTESGSGRNRISGKYVLASCANQQYPTVPILNSEYRLI